MNIKKIVLDILEMNGYSTSDEITHDDVYSYAENYGLDDLTPAMCGVSDEF